MSKVIDISKYTYYLLLVNRNISIWNYFQNPDADCKLHILILVNTKPVKKDVYWNQSHQNLRMIWNEPAGYAKLFMHLLWVFLEIVSNPLHHNRVSLFSWCLNGIYFWGNGSVINTSEKIIFWVILPNLSQSSSKWLGLNLGILLVCTCTYFLCHVSQFTPPMENRFRTPCY